MNKQLFSLLDSMGYTHIREVNGLVCGCRRYFYTVGVCIGLDEYGMSGRYCFDDMLSAALFIRDWDGVTPPVVGEDGCTAIKYHPRTGDNT